MKKMYRTLHLSLALAAVCCAAPAFAQPMNSPPPMRGPLPFAAFDLDRNGIVTEQEFNTVRAERMGGRAPMPDAANLPTFQDFDLNRDGRLTPDEFNAAHHAMMQSRRGMGPGRGMGHALPSFAEFDLNGDGSLTEQEFDTARANRIKERSQQGYGMRGLANAPTFATMDLNGDGRISPQEFAAAQTRHQQTMQPPMMPPAPVQPPR